MADKPERLNKGLLGLTVKPVHPSKGKTGKKVIPGKLPSGGSGHTWLKLSVNKQRDDHRPLWGAPKKDWHPSSLGESCDRLSILKMLGWRGDLISQKLIRVPFEPTRKLLGEIKSINDRGFKELPPVTLDSEVNFNGIMSTTGDIGVRIRGYMLQFQSYLRLTKTDEGFILFDNKNTQDYNDYLLGYHAELLDELHTRLKRLDPYRPAMLIPPCTCKGTHKALCLYRTDEEVPLADMKTFANEEMI